MYKSTESLNICQYDLQSMGDHWLVGLIIPKNDVQKSGVSTLCKVTDVQYTVFEAYILTLKI